MDQDGVRARAREQGLEAAFTAFPDGIAAAIALADAERDALAAMLLDASDAP